MKEYYWYYLVSNGEESPGNCGFEFEGTCDGLRFHSASTATDRGMTFGREPDMQASALVDWVRSWPRRCPTRTRDRRTRCSMAVGQARAPATDCESGPGQLCRSAPASDNACIAIRPSCFIPMPFSANVHRSLSVHACSEIDPTTPSAPSAPCQRPQQHWETKTSFALRNAFSFFFPNHKVHDDTPHTQVSHITKER